MTNTIHNVIIKPVFTEKSEAFKYGSQKKYYFFVKPSANKAEIKDAFISIYMIEPESINIIRRKPVWIRTGTKNPGLTKMQKIAIITLPEGISLAMTDDEVKEDKKEQKEEKKQLTSTRKVVGADDSSTSNSNEETETPKVENTVESATKNSTDSPKTNKSTVTSNKSTTKSVKKTTTKSAKSTKSNKGE